MSLGFENQQSWRVHWVGQYVGSEAQFHYCQAGIDPGSNLFSVCAGSGDCADG
jgi:hypothetical protein